jgi:hypothetical protein
MLKKMSAIAYIFDIFNKCGDNDTPVATFEATLVLSLRWTPLIYLMHGNQRNTFLREEEVVKEQQHREPVFLKGIKVIATKEV